jgi:hypothetical protein
MPNTRDKRFKAGEDKRQDERFSLHAPIIFSRVGANCHRKYASVTFNASKNGLCIESAVAIKPGTTILIHRGNLISDKGYTTGWKQVRTSSLAEVRWCRELTADFGTYYSVGAKYY